MDTAIYLTKEIPAPIAPEPAPPAKAIVLSLLAAPAKIQKPSGVNRMRVKIFMLFFLSLSIVFFMVGMCMSAPQELLDENARNLQAGLNWLYNQFLNDQYISSSNLAFFVTIFCCLLWIPAAIYLFLVPKR